MITFTSLGGLAFKCSGAEAPVTVFPDATKLDSFKDSIVLLPIPQEDEQPASVISWPGEYNVKGVSVKGIGQDEGQQVSYVAEMDGIRCAFLSSPLKDWGDKQLEMVGEIDLLALPADDAKVAQKLIDELDPRVLVLLQGKDKGDFDSIAKTVGLKSENIVGEFKLKSSLPMEGRDVYGLRK